VGTKKSWVKVAGLNIKTAADGRRYLSGVIESKNVDVRIVKNPDKPDKQDTSKYHQYLLYTRKKQSEEVSNG